MSYKLSVECCLSETYDRFIFYLEFLAHEKILLFGRKQGKYVQNVLHGTKSMIVRDYGVLILA
jgi:hypothetical protein